ncbi:MAG: TIGR00282 family metallophosphoesterase [Thermoleophilaceae bacterium]
MRLLFIGDVVGSTGREVVERLMPSLRESERPDFVVVNGENAAGGAGITPKVAEALFAAGADAITLGNHAFRHREVYELLDADARIVRPSNYPKAAPGRGHTIVERDGRSLAVVNISGMVWMDAARSPFAEADAVLAELRGRAEHVLVDFHAEASSEKVAMGWHLDGRVTACLGTHTHVPTADARVLPGGTAYISDVGMTGARGGVIGVRRELALARFLTQLPARFEPADEDPWLNAVVVDADDSGTSTAIRQLLVPYSAKSAASSAGVNQTM